MNPTANSNKKKRVRIRKRGINAGKPGQKGVFGQQGQNKKKNGPSLRTLQWQLMQQYKQITQGVQGEPTESPGKPKRPFWRENKRGQREAKEGQQEVKQWTWKKNKRGQREAKEGQREAKEGQREAEEGQREAEEGQREAEEGQREAKEGQREAKEGQREAKEGQREVKQWTWKKNKQGQQEGKQWTWKKNKQGQQEGQQGQQEGKQGQQGNKKKRGAKALPKDKDEDKCMVCYVEVSQKERLSHNRKEFHREMVAFRDQCRWEASRCKTLMETIEKTDLEKNRSVPIVGLDYIRQFLPNEAGEHVYHCKLCTGTFRPKTIFYHLLSNKHRIFYLSRHHRALGINKKFRVTDQEKWKQLIACCLEAETLSGRRELTIMDRIYYTNLTPEQIRALNPHQDALPSECDDGESEPPVKYPSTIVSSEPPVKNPSNIVSSEPPVKNPSTIVQTSSPFKQRTRAERKKAFQRGPPVQQNAVVPRFGPSQDMRRPFQSDPFHANTYPGRAMGWDNRPYQQLQPPVDDSKLSLSEKELQLLHAFVDARSKLHERQASAHAPSLSSGGAMFHDGSRPQTSQSGPVVQHVADIVGPAVSHQSTVISRSTVDIQHTVGKGGTSVRVVSVQQSTVSTVGQQHTALRTTKVPFTKGDRGHTFRELKEANETQMRHAAARGELPLKSVGVEDIEDIFWCNDELYDFLGNFVVESRADVEYVLKVVDGFAHALARHKRRTEEIRKRIEEEKRRLEEEKRAFLNIPGVSKALKSILKVRAQSPPPGKKQAALSSSSKPLFPITATVSSAAPAPASAPPKAKLPLSFDSYRPPAPPANARPSQPPPGPRAKETRHMPPSRQPSGAAVNRSQDMQGPPFEHSRSSESRPPWHEQRPPSDQLRQSTNEPRSYFESRPSANEFRRQEDDSRPRFDSRPFVDEFRRQEDSRPNFDSRPSENEFRRQEEEFRPTMNEPRLHFDSRPSENEFRQHYDSRPGFDSRPPFPKSGFDGSGPPDDSRSPSQGHRMHPYNQRLPSYEPQPHFSDQRPSHNEPRPPLNQPRVPFNDSQPPLNQPRPPFNEHTSSPSQPRSWHGPSDRNQDDGYNQSTRFPGNQFGPAIGPRASFGSGRGDESMDSYHQRYTESSYESQGRPPPDSMRSSYNMHQGQWSSEMPPREGFPPGPGDSGREGFPMNQRKSRFQ